MVIVSDCDKPGQAGGERFIKQVSQFACEVVHVTLPYDVTGSRGKDLRDYLAEYHSVDHLLNQAANNEPSKQLSGNSFKQPNKPFPLHEEYQPFSTKCLPYPLNEFITKGAKAIGCDEAYVALPLLSVVGATVGTSICLEQKNGWRVLPILWTVVLGESGSSKTPAFQIAMKAIRKRKQRSIKDNKELSLGQRYFKTYTVPGLLNY